MCGIAGLYALGASSSPSDLRTVAKAMTDAMPHRGPDDDGHWQDPDHPALVLGQRRLAILDLSPLGHQPMPSPSGRYWCVYNGEIYNYLAIEAELKKLGHQFKGRSDTEVFLTAVDQWGLNQTCQKIIGMYAFLIWDRKTRTLHLMRDRLGKKPLYFGWAGKTLVMGSELKVLMAHPDFVRDVNPDALRVYMKYGFMQAPHCIFRQVWTLPPGARMSLPVQSLVAGEDLSQKIEFYWDLPKIIETARAHPNLRSEEEIVEEFDALLRQCVRERMVADVPLGAFLSGGIDSSTVVALMQQLSDRPVKTYAIGFEEESFNEAPFAKEIARHLGTDHHEMIVSGQDALNVVPKLPDIYDEPFADSSQIPTYLVSKFARESVTVALSGDGGDEMLGGYRRHMIVPGIWAKIRWLPYPLRLGVASLLSGVPQDKWDSLFSSHPSQGLRFHRLAGMLRKKDCFGVYDYLLSMQPDYDLIVSGGRDPLTPLYDPRRDVRGLGFAEQMMFKDTMSYLPDDILVKVDRASMAVSLEARAPLLDMRIAEYVWTLPHDLKIRDGKGKWLLRQVLSKYVPQSLYDRPKKGFSVPIDSWLRGGLRDWAEPLLSPNKIKEQGYLNDQYVRKIWEGHQSGRAQAGPSLWAILMFQAWLERWGKR